MKAQHTENYGIQQKQGWVKFIAIYAYIGKEKRFQINTNFTIRKLEIEKTEPKAERKKILKIRADIK